jgi:integrase
MRASYYSDYEINGRKSLRHDKEGNPHLDKIARLDEFFGGYRASDIDSDSIRRFITDQQTRHLRQPHTKTLTNASINRSLSALRRMFSIAKKDDKLSAAPYFPMLKEAKPRQGFLDRGQYETLLGCLPDYLRLPFSIAYFSAMRLKEVLGLRWEQVDFFSNQIVLRAGETKNDEGRIVPVIPELRALLREQFAKREPGCPSVCFRLDSKGHAVKIGSFAKAWRSACVKAALGEMVPAVDAAGSPIYAKQRVDRKRSKRKLKMIFQGTIFHDLRRTGVRNLVRAGVPEGVAMAISGHKTRSTFQRYNITSANDISDAAKKLANFHDEKKRDNSGTISTEIVQSTSLTN